MNETNTQCVIWNEVSELIYLRQEGGFWDFKREWHSDDGELLLDIICMANNLCNHDAYIIIGIDEENDYQIRNVSNDEHRRKTQDIVTFLRDKKFAGNIRPTAFVNSYTIDGKTIDVITIKNSHDTPFYIVQDYKGLKAYHIYTRILDTNTPRDKSADPDKVEQLWRKHFYIDESPLKKVLHYLRDFDAWTSFDNDGNSAYYYNLAPEYTMIEIKDEIRDGYEFYFLSQIDPTPRWYSVELKYHQTTIYNLLGIALDGGRCFAIAPRRKSINYCICNNYKFMYAYFVEGSIEQTLNDFYQSKEHNDHFAFNRFMETILVFKSQEEHEAFQDYVLDNILLLKEKIAKEKQKSEAVIHGLPSNMNADYFQEEIYCSHALKKMLIEFREAE